LRGQVGNILHIRVTNSIGQSLYIRVA